MTVEQILIEVNKYCKLKNIPIVRGKVSSIHEQEIRDYLVILKRQYKTKMAEKRRKPKSIGSLIEKLRMGVK